LDFFLKQINEIGLVHGGGEPSAFTNRAEWLQNQFTINRQKLFRVGGERFFIF